MQLPGQPPGAAPSTHRREGQGLHSNEREGRVPAGTSARVANAAGMCCYRCRWAAGRDLCPLHQPLRPSPSPAPAAAEDSRAAPKPLSRPAALAETEGGTSVGALDWLASLSVDLWQRVPVYMTCLPAFAALAATARRFRDRSLWKTRTQPTGGLGIILAKNPTRGK